MIRKSKAEICEYVHQFSTACAQFALTEHDGKLDLPKVYEYLSHVWGGWQPIVLEKEEMGDRLGFTDPVRKIIALREDVYDGMCSGEKEHLYTAAHELGHMVMHGEMVFARLEKSNPMGIVNVEVEADDFAVELLGFSSPAQEDMLHKLFARLTGRKK